MSENTLAADSRELIITRVVDAPRALVWQVYTQAEHLQHWWGPKGFTTKVVTADVRPGGVFHYAQTSPDGQNTMWGKFIYQEVAPIDRLAFLSAFSDPEGNTVPTNFFPVWPLEVLNVVTFTEENGKTTIVAKGSPHNASPEEQAAFEGMRASMEHGYEGTFKNLDAYLAELQKGQGNA